MLAPEVASGMPGAFVLYRQEFKGLFACAAVRMTRSAAEIVGLPLKSSHPQLPDYDFI
jgi:hypothetical protein